jgi:AraC-like DNA-binding protein
MKKKILVVEDEFIIALDIKNILEADGFEVITNIDNVSDAIIAIEAQQPQLVLIDINLNGIKDGVDLGHYLLTKDEVPYLYLTSNADSVSLDRAKATRPQGYIVKPFKPIDLKATVAIVLNNFVHKKIDTTRLTGDLTNTTFKIKEVIKYINQNLSEKIELDQLVALTPWKKQHFIAVFNEQVGKTPYQYILERKIEHSKTLVQQNNLTLTDIAFELGFTTYVNFSKAFKKIENCTPEQFRARIVK